PLALFLIISALGFARVLDAEDGRSLGGVWLGWIGAVLAALAKGILAGLFVGFVITYAIAFARGRLRALLSPAPILVAVALLLAWYGTVLALYSDAFLSQFVSDQVTGKVTHNLLAPLIAFPGYLAVMAISFLFWPFLLVFGAPRA